MTATSSGRFATGQSGNPRGRPRKSRSIDASLLKALHEPVTVTENGRRRKIAKLDVATRQLVNKGASGELRATKLVFDLAQRAEDRAGAVAARAPVMTASDRDIAARVIERLHRLIAAGVLTVGAPEPADTDEATHATIEVIPSPSGERGSSC